MFTSVSVPVRAQLAVMRQSSSLVSSDKDYLNRQVMELQRRLDAGEERVRQALQQADQQRTQREDIYERYVRSRDEYKALFEKVLPALLLCHTAIFLYLYSSLVVRAAPLFCAYVCLNVNRSMCHCAIFSELILMRT